MTLQNKKRATPRTFSHKAKKCVDRTLAFAKRFSRFPYERYSTH